MSYKLIAIDLDDTLLDEEKVCSARNEEALRKAAGLGVHIVLTSGRVYHSIAPYVRQIGLNDYTIAAAGAHVIDPDGNIVHSTSLSAEDARAVMRWAAKRGLHYQAYPEDGLHFPHRGKWARFYEKNCNIEGTVRPDLMDMEALDTPKLLIVDAPEVIAKYKEDIRPAFPQLKFENSQPEYMEVIRPETSKGNALKWLGEKLGIRPEEMIAIGDSELDVSMLDYAGLGIVVANGSDIARTYADYVTAANSCDGVARAVEKYVLNIQS